MRNIFRLCLTLFLVCIFWQTSFGAESQSKALLEEANNAYHEGDFSLAASLYQQIIAENGYSADVLYNLANTYAQDGKPGKAIVNYQRARLLAPGDPDIKGNLEVVNKKAGLFDEEQPFFDKLTTILTFNQWCVFGLFSFGFCIAVSAAALFLPGWNVLFKIAAPISFLSTILSVYLALISAHPYISGVIIEPETALLISPHDKASTNGSIREGRLVVLVKEYNDFRYVEDRSGRTGWVKKQAVEAIIPTGRR